MPLSTSCSFLSFRSQILILNTKSALPLRGSNTQRHDDTPITDSWQSLTTPSTWRHLLQSGSYLALNPNPQWPVVWSTFLGGSSNRFFESLHKMFHHSVWVLWFQQTAPLLHHGPDPFPWHSLPQHQMLGASRITVIIQVLVYSGPTFQIYKVQTKPISK